MDVDVLICLIVCNFCGKNLAFSFFRFVLCARYCILVRDDFTSALLFRERSFCFVHISQTFFHRLLTNHPPFSSSLTAPPPAAPPVYLAALHKYMQHMSSHGVAAECGLIKRGDRWQVIERDEVATANATTSSNSNSSSGRPESGLKERSSRESNSRYGSADVGYYHVLVIAFVSYYGCCFVMCCESH